MTRPSTLRRAAALVAIPAAIAAFAAPAAWAQDADPLTVTASEDTCGRTTLTATAPAGVYEIAVYSGPNAGGAASDPIGQFSTSPDGPVSHTFTLGEDAYDGSGFVSWATIAGPEQNAFVHGAIGVATDCAPPVDEEPEPTPDPTPEPTPEPLEPPVDPVDPDPVDPDPVGPDPVEPADPADLAQNGFTAGVYEVGRDIAPGVYRTDGSTNEYGCGWERLSSNNGEYDSIIAMDYFDGPSSMTVADTDAFIAFHGPGECTWTRDSAAPVTPVDPGTSGDNGTVTDAGVLYENCAAVRDADAAPLFVTDDGYRAGLDSDGDGVACETDTHYNGSGDFSQTGDVPVGSAETGQA